MKHLMVMKFIAQSITEEELERVKGELEVAGVDAVVAVPYRNEKVDKAPEFELFVVEG